MDVVGSEIGQKMRSAIKAKLTELGCYVDDELPDYVMVMVANKRTRAQMEDDLQLFLGDNTNLFVNWLHQVLKKLQEVTVTAPIKAAEQDKSKERSASKEKKIKEKKDKSKKSNSAKKAKKKEKEKTHRKKEEKKVHKSKKKSKHHEMIRPNIPPLLMNIEKESEPSITDVFAGQILKSHGITLESLKEDVKIPETKPVIKEIKRPIVPIIDPATISSQPDPDHSETVTPSTQDTTTSSVSSTGAPKEEQLKEINEIEAKIQGLKQKLAEQLDSMSEDEDFLNIRTEAEELMNDFAEDVFQEISEQAPVTATPPLQIHKSPSPTKECLPKPVEITKEIPKTTDILPQIELNLPKRPIRERLGAREEPKKHTDANDKESNKRIATPERFTPDRDSDFSSQNKSAKSRLSDPPETGKSSSDSSFEKSDSFSKKLTSRVSVLESQSRRRSCASVVRVRPRPRVGAPASSLLLRAVADAHKSLLNIPPKIDHESHQVKRALVLPMRRIGDPKIVIQVPGDRPQDNQSDNISLGDMDSEDDKSSKVNSDAEKEEVMPTSITMKIKNTDYVPAHRKETRTASRRDDSLIIETLNIHNPTVDKDKSTQFIVTMDGFNPNAFLAKKLMTEGLLNEDEIVKDKPKETPSVLITDTTKAKEKPVEENIEKKIEPLKKRLSNESEESETNVIIKQEADKDIEEVKVEKQEKQIEKRKNESSLNVIEKCPVKKRKASPIVFDVGKKEQVKDSAKEKEKDSTKEKEKDNTKERQRTESVSSDGHVVVTTAVNTHKYDSLPPLSQAERKPVWCRAFPMCRYGSACAFQHPRCKFAAGCTRRNCVYSHAPNALPAPVTAATVAPSVSSHVVPAANYKTISPAALPSMCKFYPNCVNPGCPFYHPKPCRYGPACLNKLECNFYHAEVPLTKWRFA